jgi:hypothetical protein
VLNVEHFAVLAVSGPLLGGSTSRFECLDFVSELIVKQDRLGFYRLAKRWVGHHQVERVSANYDARQDRH